jgi:hypothetical protein
MDAADRTRLFVSMAHGVRDAAAQLNGSASAATATDPASGEEQYQTVRESPPVTAQQPWVSPADTVAKVDSSSASEDDATTSAPPSATPAPAGAGRVFVSWAHADVGSTEDERAAWAREVVEFAGLLRRFGVDADLDLFYQSDTSTDWTRFGPKQVADADYVIIAVSQAWADRWSGANATNVGAGAVGEADTLKGIFQTDQSLWQRKVLIVILPSQTDEVVPLDLKRVNRFEVDPDDPASFDALIRAMTDQPLYVKPDLGVVPTLPPVVSKSLSTRPSKDRSKEDSQYLALRKRLQKTMKMPVADIDKNTVALISGLLDASED